MPAAKKTTPPAKRTPPPAPTPEVVPDIVEPPAEPQGPATATQDFCPQPHNCFPAGLPDGATWAGCEHGEWAFE